MNKFLIAALVSLFAVACGDGAKEPDLLENGAACAADNEDEVCTDPAFCLEEFENGTPVAGGMCTDECEWNEDYTDTCSDGELCLRYNPTGEKVCFQGCSADADCREDDGYSCLCLDFFCQSQACVPDLSQSASEELPADSPWRGQPTAILFDTALETLELLE